MEANLVIFSILLNRFVIRSTSKVLIWNEMDIQSKMSNSLSGCVCHESNRFISRKYSKTFSWNNNQYYAIVRTSWRSGKVIGSNGRSCVLDQHKPVLNFHFWFFYSCWELFNPKEAHPNQISSNKHYEKLN